MQRKQRAKVKEKGKKKQKEKEKEKVKLLKAKENKEESLKAKPKIQMLKERRKTVVIGCIEEHVLVAPNAAISTTQVKEGIEMDDPTAQADHHLQATENRVRSPEEENLRLDYQTGHPVIIGYQENAEKETNAIIFM